MPPFKPKVGQTIGDSMDAFLACKTEDEARAFMDAYREYNSFADENICFMIGFYTSSKEESITILERAGIDWKHWIEYWQENPVW